MFFTDLDFMTIEETREETVWPPSDLYTVGLIPYLNRHKQPTIEGLVVCSLYGPGKGEAACHILESCPKVSKLHVYEQFQNEYDEETRKKFHDISMKNLSRFGDRVNHTGPHSSMIGTHDFIFFDDHVSEERLLENMKFFYPRLKERGIFAGTHYHMNMVRNALKTFRNETKTRPPILSTSNDVWFWIKEQL